MVLSIDIMEQMNVNNNNNNNKWKNSTKKKTKKETMNDDLHVTLINLECQSSVNHRK
jgi:ribonuclease HI